EIEVDRDPGGRGEERARGERGRQRALGAGKTCQQQAGEQVGSHGEIAMESGVVTGRRLGGANSAVSSGGASCEGGTTTSGAVEVAPPACPGDLPTTGSEPGD